MLLVTVASAGCLDQTLAVAVASLEQTRTRGGIGVMRLGDGRKAEVGNHARAEDEAVG